jgi:hypothetical protein
MELVLIERFNYRIVIKLKFTGLYPARARTAAFGAFATRSYVCPAAHTQQLEPDWSSGNGLDFWSGGTRSNLGHDIRYPGGFPQSFHANAGIVPRFGHDRFLTYLFQLSTHSFIIIPSNSYSLDTGRESLNNQRK